MTDHVNKLEVKFQNLSKLHDNQDLSGSPSQHLQQIKDLELHRKKLEAQIRFGLDSLKVEQDKVRNLERELERYTIASATSD